MVDKGSLSCWPVVLLKYSGAFSCLDKGSLSCWLVVLLIVHKSVSYLDKGSLPYWLVERCITTEALQCSAVQDNDGSTNHEC
jgi:hypothetical protein